MHSSCLGATVFELVRERILFFLKSNNNILLLKCMFMNLSLYFDKGGLRCMPGSFVKIIECNFTSNDEEKVVVVTKGD